MKKHGVFRLFLILFLAFLILGTVRNLPALQKELTERLPVLKQYLQTEDEMTDGTNEYLLPTITPDPSEDPDGTDLPEVTATEMPAGEPIITTMPVDLSGFQADQYYYTQLDETSRAAYDLILEAVKMRQESVWIPVSDGTQIDRIYHGLLKDHPELFWIHNRKEVYETVYPELKKCLFTPSYLYTDQEVLEIQQTMEQAFQELSARIGDGADAYQIAEAVYIYLIDETDYVESEDDQSIAGVFWKKQAVCAGYAGAVQYLLGRFGVPCIYVDGSVEGRTDGHAWNIMELDGSWYYVDATNGDQPEFLMGDFAQLEEHKTTLMDFLCPFPWEYEINYHASDEFDLPECTATDQNFYVRNQGIFSGYDWQSVYDYCCMRINNNAAVVRFKFREEEPFKQAVNDWIHESSIQEVAQYYMRRNGLNQVQYHYGILEELKTIYFIF